MIPTLFLLAASVPHVLIIGVDGLSGDAFRRSDIPNLRQLMDTGAWTLKSRGVMPTVSSPNWASLLSGAGPELHGVHSNDWERTKFKIAPACTGPEGIFPTMFSVIRAQRAQADLAAIHDWDGFGRLVEGKSATYVADNKDSVTATDAAIKYWTEHKPTLLFVHLDDVDHAGHEKTWEGREYKAAVERIDALIGRMMAAVPRDKSLIVIVSDHGGNNKSHGNDTTNEVEVPLIFSGPGVPKGEIKSLIRSVDVAPIVVNALGLQPHACWEGRVVPGFSPSL